MGRVIFGRIGRNDAVPVEAGLGKNLLCIGGVLQGDGRGVILAKTSEDLPRRSQHLLPFGRGLIDGAQRQFGSALEQIIRIFQTGARPLHGRNQFRGADAAVLIRIDQVQRLCVKVEAGRGTRKGDPQLLIEFVDRHQIGACVQPDLVKTAGTEEFPSMIRSHNSHLLN